MKVKSFFCKAFGAILLVAIGLFLFYNSATTKGLQSRQFVDQFAHCQETVPSSLSSERLSFVNEILGQPFRFLGRGKQCSAYLSKDGRYVLKFLLSKPLTPSPKITNLPDVFPLSSLKESRIHRKMIREATLLNSFVIAADFASEETGTIFLHLNTTDEFRTKTLLIDPKSNGQVINVNEIKWVLQKKASHVKLVLAELMSQGKIDEAKNRINQLFDLLFQSAKRGIYDADPNLIRNNNVGFLPERAIYIDTGKLRISDTILDRSFFENDVKRLSSLYKWLVKYYPVLAEHYITHQNELVALF